MGTAQRRMPCGTFCTSCPSGITHPDAARTRRGAAANTSIQVKTLKIQTCLLGQQRKRKVSSNRKITSIMVSMTAAGTPRTGEPSTACATVTRVVQIMKNALAFAKKRAATLDSGFSMKFHTRRLQEERPPRIASKVLAFAKSSSLRVRHLFSRPSGLLSSSSGTEMSWPMPMLAAGLALPTGCTESPSALSSSVGFSAQSAWEADFVIFFAQFTAALASLDGDVDGTASGGPPERTNSKPLDIGVSRLLCL
mmetsp:Transcript_112080/g.327846  ORF Transcript_112080/g.327846 Transcript_112080/m.327846 type:complete len:252 (-) Transcript_112080:733-1488(-)